MLKGLVYEYVAEFVFSGKSFRKTFGTNFKSPHRISALYSVYAFLRSLYKSQVIPCVFIWFDFSLLARSYATLVLSPAVTCTSRRHMAYGLCKLTLRGEAFVTLSQKV